MRWKGQASVKGSTTLFLATCGVVRLVLLIGGPFRQGAREGGDESPFNKGPPTTRKPWRNQSTLSLRWPYFERWFYFVCKMSTRARRRQKLGGASYDTFSVQYQKNNFYLAGARKPRCLPYRLGAKHHQMSRKTTRNHLKCFFSPFDIFFGKIVLSWRRN